MKKSVLSVFVVALLIAHVSSHVAMVEPASRGSAWRRFADWPMVHPQDDMDMCFAPGRNTRCGICGPVYNNNVSSSLRVMFGGGDARRTAEGGHYNETHFSFEKGGPYYTGKIAATYKKGQVVKTGFVQLAGHGGFHEFRICNADGVEDPQNDCFEGNVLRDITGRTRIPHENIWRPLSPLRNVNGSNYRAVPPFSSGFVFGWDIQLPANLTCKHCIFQWRWLDTLSRQDYVGCADITITE